MAIRSRINHYQGINAHYQSAAQYEMDGKGWKPFHSVYITVLLWHIQDRLPPRYRIEPEDSLQINLIDPDSGREKQSYPVGDATIWEVNTNAEKSSQSPQVSSATPIITQDIADTIEEAEEWTALVISEIRKGGKAFPITRLEVFSPTNKVGSGRVVYLKGRAVTLRSGVSLVEIDYLHETDSPIKGVPGYASHDPDSYPYTITINDARSGKTNTYGFGVDEPILPLEVPLAGDENVLVDFGEIYRTSFQNTLAFSDRVDYASAPAAFETYHRADQQRIWARMLAVIDAERAGQDLNHAALLDLSDDSAMNLLKNMPYQQAHLLVDEKTLDAVWLVHQKQAGVDEIILLQCSANNPQPERLLSGNPEKVAAAFHRLKSIFDQDGFDAFLAEAKKVSP